jgi:iron complex outermembrane receptor protein
MDLLKPSDFSNTHITDTKELITKTPGIEVIDGQASIRGGTGFSYGVGSRVLALIDGLPVLSPDAGNIKWQFLPLENIAQVEIIKGASSVLYGSSALNGIINFRTAPASDNPDTKFFAETGIFGKPRNENWIWWNSPRIFSTVSFSHLQKAGKNDIGAGLSFMDNTSYRKFNDESLGRLSLRFKHYDSRMKGLTWGMNINSGYTEKTDFVLWENAETGALKQDTSSVSALHGSFLAADPFISFDRGGKIKHDLRFRVQSSANKFPVRSRNNSSAYSAYGEYQGSYSGMAEIDLSPDDSKENGRHHKVHVPRKFNRRCRHFRLGDRHSCRERAQYGAKADQSRQVCIAEAECHGRRLTGTVANELRRYEIDDARYEQHADKRQP